ncbi:Rap1a/Tai family immunity protein [Thaumasiovibrio subtropicus]|uniref:Rap1a/Tai family immunity protein n=1 Tax=Thaumasiovibrio subtropicus TaxID=1891207 RepID=UPI000B3604AA|nr:Rap1a/Tai family immunity protein [Thaumasiovibrio subtropicus]
MKTVGAILIIFVCSSLVQASEWQDINKNADHFYQALASSDRALQANAQHYLQGVIDATEGVYWCDASKFKMEEVHARVNSDLANTSATERKSFSAAEAIIRVISDYFPC